MTIMAQAFLSSSIVTPGGARRGAMLVESGRIRAICGASEVPATAEKIDLGDYAILPGLVDTHVHINQPGRTEWEGFRSATRAAAAGGFTTLVDMPLNCLPETTTVAALEAKRASAAGECFVDWLSWGGAVGENQAHLLPLAAAGVPGFKCFLIDPGCEGFTSIDREQLEAALPHIASTGLPLLVHAELAAPIEAATAALQQEDWRRYATYLASRPDEAELEAIGMTIELCRRYRFRLHIVHLSTAAALPLLRQARAEGLSITVETCPHYLHFAAEQIPDGATLFKCAPPIRSAANREGLWLGLAAGTIDCIVTDHSPCPPGMKRLDTGRFDEAWGGVASLSLALPVIYTECLKRRGGGGLEAQENGLEDIARWMSSAPSALAGISHRAGSLEAGREASFSVFDGNAVQTITEDRLYFRHAISPYVGETLRGAVRATYLRGEEVYREGVFTERPAGRELALF